MSSNELILAMGAAYRGAMDLFKEVIPRKEKQSTLALAILIHVEKKPGISQGELGKMLRRDAMTMSQAIRGLQDLGLIFSQPDEEDRRMKRLTVTKKGKGLGLNLEEAENKFMTGLSREWGKSRVNQFAKDLSEFNEYLNRSRNYFNGN
ncbi:MAG: MarR family transcriptional regulator [Spirochaetia bacterium]|nr:MarR family transcriptional regulator [Spirochaetia bacterium]